ncbi:60S ribosomal protein L14 [Taenia crassiceps]|uniref:Large ribosomal subunit protein eL14 n=1 Tax=Taenia crassiceps TaxID=6207 RepID=A0ABR4Q4A9_9CEST
MICLNSHFCEAFFFEGLWNVVVLCVPRRPVNIKRLHLTKFVLKIPVNCGTRGVEDLWRKQKIGSLWEKSMWARKLEKKRIRAGLNDFERFQVMVARKTRNRIISNYRMRKTTLQMIKNMRPKKKSA